ncbi:MAG: hypothetical protein E7345_05190 [Clostridiales bacterium]|nr:hypothetical protein [Clostridiales bacterium]
MKENFLHFISETPFILNINGETIEKVDNEKIFECDIITNTENMFVTYLPITTNKNYISYTYLLDMKSTPKTDNSNIKIIPFPNNHYDIIMTPFSCNNLTTPKVISNTQVGNYFVSIVNDANTKITILSGASIVFCTNIPLIKQAKVEMKKDFIIITGLISENEFYLLIINCENFKIVFSDYSHSIENTSEYIQSLKNLNDISKTAIVHKLDFKSKNIEEFFVYQNETDHKVKSDILIAMNFLECIQIGNENKAKELLSDSYNNVNLSTFNNYFGKIKEIHLNRHEDFNGKANYTIIGDNIKNYNFILENHHIQDIEEVFI